ncbi:MAG: 16S rRNA (cytosine(1402)-N(4))-methyltransferase, partial [Actinomycetota bacterium]
MSETREFRHAPVMEREIVETFAVVPAGHIVDATLGGAGHSVALLEARADISIIGVDRDEVALAAARDRLAHFGARATTRHAAFGDLSAVLAGVLPEVGATQVSGALFDLGVSSPHAAWRVVARA